jgi:hypothetical protein
MMLDVSENARLVEDSFDSWLGYMFLKDDAVVGSSSLGRVSEPTCVGLVAVDGFKCEFSEEEVRWMFSRILHMLGFREEPFMKETLDRRAMSRESLIWGCWVKSGGGREWTRCWISLARVVASGSLKPSGGTCMGLECQ